MRKITSMMSQWRADTQNGTSLRFEQCKGGYFSTDDEYGLKLIGKTEQDGTPAPDTPVPIQCVKSGTKVSCYGKNIFDVANRATGLVTAFQDEYNADSNILRVFIPSTSSAFSYAGKYYVIGKYAELKGKDITVSYKYKTSAESSGMIRIGYRKSDTNTYKDAGEYIKLPNSTEESSITFTLNIETGIGEDEIYNGDLVISMYANAGGAITSADNGWIEYRDIQIEIGDTATEYEAYKGKSEITVPCDLYEGDIWYPMSGRVEHHSKSIILSGEETGWTKYVSAPNYYQIFVGDNDYITQSQTYYAISNYYLKRAYYTDDLVDYAVFSADGERIRFRNIDIDTLEDWISWVKDKYDSGTPLSVVYKLKTPVTEQRDEWGQKIFAPQGTVNILQSTAELEADMEAVMLVRR